MEFSADTELIQLFTDGPLQFVLADEMKEALNGTPYSTDPRRKWHTLDAKIARTMAKRSTKDIQFVPIPRNVHGTIVIMTPTGATCLLAADALRDVLFDMVLELKVFQNLTLEKWERIMQFFKTIDKYLSLETKSQFFLPVTTVEEIMGLAYEQFSPFPVNPKPSTGSIPQQLIHLGLIRQTSEIQNYPGLVALLRRDPEVTLHQCVFACLLEKFKILGTFVHRQKGCHKLFRCRVCVEGEAQEESLEMCLQGILNDAKNAHEQLVKMPKESKKPEVKSKKQKAAASTPAPKPAPPAPTPASTSTPSQPVQKPESLNMPKPQNQPESKVCPKCIRTSDHCKKAKEELKGAENQIKKLKKNLSEAEKALERERKQRLEAEEELRVLREQMEEMKKARQVVKVPEPSPEVLELKKNLADFQDKLHIVQDQDPIHKATQQITRLITISNNETVKDRSRLELLKVQLSYNEYTNALEKNIKNIQIVLNNAPKLLPVPEYPELSPVFFKELQKAEDAKNKELEQECVICHDAVDEKKKEDLFQCPECNKKVHLTCVSKWWEINDSCPHCRAEWK